MAGRPKTGGRTRGVKNKRTMELERAQAETAVKITDVLGAQAFPGDAHALLMGAYKDHTQPIELRVQAAKAAIGYEKPRLTAVDAKVEGTLGSRDAGAHELRDRSYSAMSEPALPRPVPALRHLNLLGFFRTRATIAKCRSVRRKAIPDALGFGGVILGKGHWRCSFLRRDAACERNCNQDD